MSEARALALLIVEDEALIRRSIRLAVERAGHVVRGTDATVAEAIDLVTRFAHEIDAAILDLNLRGDLSPPVAEALRDAGIPTLVLTGYSEDDARDAGMTAPVLHKPFRAHDPIEALDAVVADRGRHLCRHASAGETACATLATRPMTGPGRCGQEGSAG